MEATSLYLVVFELILAIGGGGLFLQDAISKGGEVSRTSLYVVMLMFVSSFWFMLSSSEGRFLGLKASLFVGCLYLASRFPRQGALLVVGVILANFSERFVSEEFGSKYLVLPILLIACGLLLFRRGSLVRLMPLYIIASFEAVYEFSVGARGLVLSALLSILIVFSVKVSRMFLKYGRWVPLAYLVVVVGSYFSLLLKLDWFDSIGLAVGSQSNFERSSMIFVAVTNFFDYPIIGPRGEFDTLVSSIMDVFDFPIYDSAKGIDPHSFLLSLWRDEGAILTLLWLWVWFFYWKILKVLQFRLHEKRIRIALAMVASAVIQFTLSPPDTGTRLLVALILGTMLGFTQNRTLVSTSL